MSALQESRANVVLEFRLIPWAAQRTSSLEFPMSIKTAPVLPWEFLKLNTHLPKNRSGNRR
jgi:hypothetical protein